MFFLRELIYRRLGWFFSKLVTFVVRPTPTNAMEKAGVVIVTECSDVHIRMIHLRQANKRDNDLAAFRLLQTENLFTDMTLVLKVMYCRWTFSIAEPIEL